MNDFRAVWSHHYPDCHPFGYLLRIAHRERWTRVHSLPELKRYPENADEAQILLQRHNTLGGEVLGEGSCWLAQCFYDPVGELDHPSGPEYWACSAHELTFAYEFTIVEQNGERERWCVHAGRVQWETGAFDRLLLEIADDRAAKTLWIAEASGAVLAPYDGGVDIILPERSAIQALKRRHAAWLPQTPSGL